MSLNEEERNIIVKLEIDKAKNIFSQIDDLAKLGYWDNIANRLYYSVFHAVSALLIHDKHNAGTHKGVAAMFGQYYVKPGVFSPTEGRLYSKLQSIREKSDYNCTFVAREEDISPMIGYTKVLIEQVERIINS